MVPHIFKPWSQHFSWVSVGLRWIGLNILWFCARISSLTFLRTDSRVAQGKCLIRCLDWYELLQCVRVSLSLLIARRLLSYTNWNIFKRSQAYIYQIATHHLFCRLLTQAGLVDYINDPRKPRTVFAPNNKAWADVANVLPKPLKRCVGGMHAVLLGTIQTYPVRHMFAASMLP